MHPVRCMTCGKVIGDLFRGLIKACGSASTRSSLGAEMDKRGVRRACCRRHLVAYIG